MICSRACLNMTIVKGCLGTPHESNFITTHAHEEVANSHTTSTMRNARQSYLLWLPVRRESKPSSNVKEPTAAALVSSMRRSSTPTPCRRFTQAYGSSAPPRIWDSGLGHVTRVSGSEGCVTKMCKWGSVALLDPKPHCGYVYNSIQCLHSEHALRASDVAADDMHANNEHKRRLTIWESWSA